MLSNFHADCDIKGPIICKSIPFEIKFPNIEVPRAAILKGRLRILKSKNLTTPSSQCFEQCPCAAAHIHNSVGLKVEKNCLRNGFGTACCWTFDSTRIVIRVIDCIMGKWVFVNDPLEP